MAGKFVLRTAKDGQFYFNLKASNGEVILTSEMYTEKRGALNGIASVIKNSPDVNRYNKLVAASGKQYFTLRAGNNQVIGNSEMYDSEKARDAGIQSVKKHASGAKTEVVAVAGA